jgi:hypothetical protein
MLSVTSASSAGAAGVPTVARPLVRRTWFQLLVIAGLIGLWLLYAVTGIALVQQRQQHPGGSIPAPKQGSPGDALDGSK